MRGARGASGHACSTGLSTGRRLMPMKARCGDAAPCRGATTVRQLPHTRQVVERAQSACSCSCMRGCGRKLSCIGMRGCGRKRKGVDENSWQSRQLHRRFQRLTVLIVQSNVCRALAGCVERTAGHASVWIATSFACGCSCTRSVSSTQPAASHHAPRVSNCLTVAAPRHGAAAPQRAVMGIKRRPVERPVEHACAEAPRAPRN